MPLPSAKTGGKPKLGKVYGSPLFGRVWSATIGTGFPDTPIPVTPPGYESALAKYQGANQNLSNLKKRAASLEQERLVILQKRPLNAQEQATYNTQHAAAIVKLQQATAQVNALRAKVPHLPTPPVQKAQAIEVTDLDISFKIEKSTKDEPNKCEFKVWNLSEAERAAIEELNPVTKAVPATAKGKVKKAARKQATSGIPLRIEAGYEEGNLSLLWIGDIRTANSEYSKPDWITTFESGDGEKAFQNARVHVSYGPKTPKDIALRAIVRALGVGEGNVQKVADKMRIKGLVYPQGTVLAGPAAREMSDICRSADLEWSIQDGAIQIIDRGTALADRAILISAETGMISSPAVDVDGILKVKILMTPDVRPGRLVQVESQRVQGGYRIDKCTYSGDTFGNDWECDLVCSRY